jgi:serine/threonine-protein kinase
VVHRDIKPANILVDRLRQGAVYVCDFGLGRDLDDPEPAPLCNSTGTPLYMAPERLTGQSCDEILCDIYALGVTLAEAATLVSPFSIPEGLPHRAWRAHLLRSRPRRLHEVAPWLPLTVHSIIGRSMSRNPHDRYPNMTALIEALQQACRTLPQTGEGMTVA